MESSLRLNQTENAPNISDFAGSHRAEDGTSRCARPFWVAFDQDGRIPVQEYKDGDGKYETHHVSSTRCSRAS